ncbi:MAG: InlB B-repeat-containing protein, partial [Eubacteriales bacterium]
PPDGYFWVLASVGDVCNITDDKTVTLTKVESSLYEAVDTSKLTITKGWLTDEVKEKYEVVLSHNENATKNPALQSWALVLFEAGQTVEWKADAAGKMKLMGAHDKTGQHLTLGLYIDGYLWETFEVSKGQGMPFETLNIPAGMHTFRLEVLAATVDEGGEGYSEWSGLAFSQVVYQELKPTTATVTFMNGGEVVDTVTVPLGETVSAPATNPEKRYYLFQEWQKDGVAYDFTTAVSENIVLTAAFERDPAYVTVTFDNEGVTETVFLEKNATAIAPAAPTKDGYTFGGWLLNDETFDFETAVAEDITLTAKWTADTAEYTVTFVDTEGATISTVKVLEGRDIDLDSLPNAGTDKYYAASTEDWKKCFGVTQNETVTLTLCTKADDYTDQIGDTWITWEGGVTTAKEKMNLVFSEDWRIEGANAGMAQQAGRYLTVSGDICWFRFGYYLDKGATTVLKVYVDDCLVETVTLDNSEGTGAMQTTIPVTRFLAGQHTIKVEIAEGSCAITRVALYRKPVVTESADTESADTAAEAQVQAILVPTKENGI